jgi:hypothetical protein
MANLARKSNNGLLMDAPDRLDFPTLHLSGEQVADLGLWEHEMGATTKMQASVRVAAKSQDAGEERHVTLEIIDAVVAHPVGINADRMFPTTVAALPRQGVK